MPISLRAAALRAALERATGTPVHLLAAETGLRLYLPAPGDGDPAWAAVLQAMRSADRWGSTNTSGATEIWVEVDDEAKQP
ncbi:hypothetical protein [Streptomyces caeruleatus]|uniref:Uncharacterized protein n=1 Tax=Streptomyces caeruleatus TaxID=661399 RepID=A0A117RI36_9ACTN|nr:hypothetical protein [Streptomyces caeruleatus]KUN92021.1 hypothetical protein AQJ67_41235 [Streptomyces caeruleatus]